MKALTLQQPWAWAIIHGPKRIENRSWPTSHRGPLLIHAGKSKVRLGAYGPGEPAERDLVFGAIVGVVDVVDCVDVRQVRGQPFAEGPLCWIIDNPLAIDPIQYSGSMGLFDVPDRLLPQQVLKRIGV